MSRHSTIAPREVRGIASRFSPFMVRCDHAQVFDGELLRASGLLAWLGGKWVDAENRTRWDPHLTIPSKDIGNLDDFAQARLASAIGLRQRYEWAVALGLENSPSIRFATDPTGIKDIFRIRANCHWCGDRRVFMMLLACRSLAPR